MNRGNRHMRYRKSVYRRQRIRTVLIVAAVVLCVLLLSFFLIGNLFFDKLQSDPDHPVDTDTTETNPTPSFPFETVRHVKAPLLSPMGSTSTIYARLDNLIETGHTAVCLPLTDENGTLLYHSEQAAANRYAVFGTATLSLAEFSEAAHAEGVYLCGTYVLAAAKEENALSRSVLLAESAAVISEAFLSGMDDIVIVVPDFPVDRQAEMLRFVESIRTFAPKAVIGLSLPEAEVASPDALRIETLAKSFDYLALDLGGYGQEDPIAFAEARMSSMLYYLLRYEMRVLLPSLPDETAKADLIAAVEKESLDNWMTVQP